MKKIIVAVSSLIFVASVFGQVKKETVKPVVKPVVKTVTKAVEPAATSIIVEDFENLKKDEPKGGTYITIKEGQTIGNEQTSDDVLNITTNTDPAFLKSGKQSLKVEYIPKQPSENKYAMISISSDKKMGDHKTLSYWIYAVKSKGVITINLFDKIKWKKGIAQDTSINFKGWKNIILEPWNYTEIPDWTNVSIVQIVVKGESVFYLDDIKYIKTGAKPK
jgi:hypothetical protein